MRTWKEINESLAAEPDANYVKPPDEQHGIMGPYLEGSYVIAVLNQVFGTECWGSVQEHNLSWQKFGDPDDPTFIFCYCQGSYSFSGLDANGNVVTTVKPDVGIGVAQRGKNYPIKPQQFDTALKGSTTDLIKRCARQLGAKSGLWLYFDEKEASALFLGKELEEKDVRAEKPKAEDRKEPSENYLGPFVYPGKKFADMVADKVNEHGKVEAAVLVQAGGDDAVGYLKWLWPKLEASDKTWDKQAGADLKAWLDKNVVTKAEASQKVPEPEPKSDAAPSAKAMLVTLLKSAKDDAKASMPITSVLKKYLAEAGYANKDGSPNDFHIYNLIRPILGDEHANLNSLTVKQIKSLVNYCNYVIENGEGGKEFAKGILTIAWGNGLSWKEACDTFAAPDNLGDLLQAVNPKMSVSDLEPVLVGLGWPKPLPVKEAGQFLKEVKAYGWALFDDSSTSLAKAMAMEWAKN